MSPAPPRSLAVLVALARAIAATSGRAGLHRALSLYTGLGIVGVVVFNPTGMRPADLTDLARASLPARLALWGLWLLLATPVARALFREPTAVFLRALPAPRWSFLAVYALLLAAFQVPWALLWARGAGVPAALAASVAAVALEALFVAGVRRPRDVFAALGLAAALARGAGPAVLGLGAALAAVVTVGAAWDRAPEEGTASRSVRLRGAAPAVLAQAYSLALVRLGATAAARGFGAVLVGAAFLAFALRHNAILDAHTQLVVALAVGAAPLAYATAGIAAPVVAAERRIRWLLATTAQGPARCVIATLTVTAGSGAAAGLAYGVVGGIAGGVAGLDAPWVAAGAAAWGGALGVAAEFWQRWAEDRHGTAATRAVVAMVLTVTVAAAVAVAAGAWAIALGAGLALVAARGCVVVAGRPGDDA